MFAEYAKASPDDILIRITVANRGPEAATLHLLPTLWFRNTWSWGCTHEGCEVEAADRARLAPAASVARASRRSGSFDWSPRSASGRRTAPTLLFTENETNVERLFGAAERRRRT